MISTLADLIAPATESEFIALLRARELSFRRANGENRYSGLIDWATVRGIVERGDVSFDRLRVTRNGRRLAPVMYADNGKVNAARLAALFAQGISVIVNHLEKHAPAVDTLREDIRARLGERVDVIAVATTGDGGAFTRHYDYGDVLVLQIEGSKRWRIYGAPVAYPVKRMPKPAQPDTAPIFDEVLRAGDFLVLPSGYWHHCDNGPELSLHLSCLIQPRHGLHVLRAIEQQLAAEEIFRTPLLRRDARERAAHEAALKARLIELIDRASFGDIVANIKDEPAKRTAEDDD